LIVADGSLAQTAAPAAPAAPPAPKLDTGDTAWMMVATAIVLLMTIPGLALFYGGMVRKKNVLATVTQCFAITCLVTVLWMVYGYSLAFTEGGMNAYIGGLSKAMFAGVTNETVNSLAGTIPEWVFITFQMTFAIITPALIVGAFAERIKFSSLLWFIGLWVTFVYFPVAHWVWGGGFLGSGGVLDFAGGTVVHINAGIAGLVACIIIGKRKGYGTTSMAPHNLVLSMIGASLLWVGWFGFNAGSAVASLLGVISGAVAGLVAITPAAGFVNPTGGLIIGILAGIGCYIASVHVKKALGYDDSLDVFGVHGVGGIIGAILTGVFADAAINELGKDASVTTQIYGVVVTIVYTAIVTAIILYIVKAVIGLRPSEAAEEEGLDITLHGETVQ